MAVSAGFKEYVLEQLSQVTQVTLRSMFGGVGVYSRGFFFALMDNDTLFFKVDESNRSDYEARGMGAFRPFGDDRTSLQYYELPAEILEDTDLLRAWVGKSVSSAMRKSAQKRSRRRKAAVAPARGKQPAKTSSSAGVIAGTTASNRKNTLGGKASRSSRLGTTRRGKGTGRHG